jgi:hypothetical protein
MQTREGTRHVCAREAGHDTHVDAGAAEHDMLERRRLRGGTFIYAGAWVQGWQAYVGDRSGT